MASELRSGLPRPKLAARRRRVLATLAAALAWAAGPRLATAARAEVEQAAADYRALRRRKGHFDGAAWQPELDAWNGRKHRAMRLLGEHLAAELASPAAARELMGAPDAVEPAAGREVWLYRWRGNHDLLALAFEQGACVAATWRSAGEQRA